MARKSSTPGPSPEQIATTLFAYTRFNGKKTERNKWLQEKTGLKTLWINKIMKNKIDWPTSLPHAHYLGSLEAKGQLPNEGPWWDL